MDLSIAGHGIKNVRTKLEPSLLLWSQSAKRIRDKGSDEKGTPSEKLKGAAGRQCNPQRLVLIYVCLKGLLGAATQYQAPPPAATQCKTRPKLARQCKIRPKLARQCKIRPPVATQSKTRLKLARQCQSRPPVATHCKTRPKFATQCKICPKLGRQSQTRPHVAR